MGKIIQMSDKIEISPQEAARAEFPVRDESRGVWYKDSTGKPRFFSNKYLEGYYTDENGKRWMCIAPIPGSMAHRLLYETNRVFRLPSLVER